MTTRTYSLRASQAVSALLFATACGLTGCAPDDGDTNLYQPPANGGLVQDASAVVVADAGTQTQQPPVTTPDSGTIKPLDSGAPVVTTDTGVPVVTGDAGPVATGDAGADAGGATRPDQGMGDGKDVITMGDSWMNLMANVGIENSLERVSKRDYRNFGVSGTKLLDEAIPGQYEKAKMGGAIKTVIMTGGGNDILQDLTLLLGGCLDADWMDGGPCPKRIDEVAARLVKLWAEMATDGVQDVVIVGYSNKTMPLGLGSTSKSIAYSNTKIPPLCAMVPAPLRCWTMDTDMEVPDLKTRSDGIHPDDASYDKIGAAVWKLMQDKGMRR
jgi:lysophospholipase L1-like esterase